MDGRTHRYMTKEPLYPFGFGLSYTRFTYGDLELSPAEIDPGADTTVSVEATNAGSVAAEEVVQLYVTDDAASTSVPLASLAGFRRVRLKPGESRTVTFELTPQDLELVNDAGERVLESRAFTVTIGGASPGAWAVALGGAKPTTGRLVVR